MTGKYEAHDDLDAELAAIAEALPKARTAETAAGEFARPFLNYQPQHVASLRPGYDPRRRIEAIKRRTAWLAASLVVRKLELRRAQLLLEKLGDPRDLANLQRAVDVAYERVAAAQRTLAECQRAVVGAGYARDTRKDQLDGAHHEARRAAADIAQFEAQVTALAEEQAQLERFAALQASGALDDLTDPLPHEVFAG